MPSSGGNSPDSSFFDRSTHLRTGSDPSSLGMGPVRALRSNNRVSREVRPPNSGGISPVSMFAGRRSSSRRANFPNSGGRGPVNPVALMCRIRRAPRSPISGGRLPRSSLTKPNLKPTTRPSSTLTPVHSPRGASVPQDGFPSQAGPRRAW